MKLKEYINSGVLEAYVLGEPINVSGPGHPEEMAKRFPEVKKELLAINEALQHYAISHAIAPPPALKPLLLATIEYLENVHKLPSCEGIPALTAHSSITDYAPWLEGSDILPTNFKGIYAKIIGLSATMTTAIVWLEGTAPEEIHHEQYERFLILEGTCTVAVEGEAYDLIPGDFFEIPLHKSHTVTITSSFPCIAILQRVAA